MISAIVLLSIHDIFALTVTLDYFDILHSPVPENSNRAFNEVDRFSFWFMILFYYILFIFCFLQITNNFHRPKHSTRTIVISTSMWTGRKVWMQSFRG